MNKQAAYELGVELALREAGLLKEAYDPNAPMDPGVRRGIRERRWGAVEQGNQYAKGYNKNVPMSSYVAGRVKARNTSGGAGVQSAPMASKPAATATAQAAPATKKPFDLSAAVGRSGQGNIDKINALPSG